MLYCVIQSTRSHNSLKSQRKEEVRKAKAKNNYFKRRVSSHQGMIHSLAAQLARGLITQNSCSKADLHPELLPGSRQFLPVIWVVTLPKSKTLLRIRQNSNPQLLHPAVLVPGTLCLLPSTQHPALSLNRAEPSQPQHQKQPFNRSMGFLHANLTQLLQMDLELLVKKGGLV